MQTFVDASSYDSPDPQRLPAGFGRGLVASFEETAISGPVFGGYLLNEVRKAGETGRLLSQEEAKAYIAAEGFTDIDVPEAGLTDAQAEMLVTLRRDRQEGEDVISRASGVANFVGSVGGGFADPAMGLLNFVPIVGASREAAIIARASARSGALGRLGARAAVGAVEGAVGGVMSAPLTGLVKEGLGDDYTMEDALAEIGTSAVFGGAIQGGTGALADAVAKLADRSSRGWVKKHFGTESLEWKKIEDQDKALREALAPEKTAEIDDEVVRAADDAEAVVRLEEPAATPERVSQAVRDALGDRPILRAADEGADPFSVSVARAIQDSQEAVAADPAGIMPLVKVFDAIAKDRQKGLSVAESIESGALSKMGPTQAEAARVAMEIHDQPERMQRFVSSFVEARKNWNSRIALEEAIAKVSTLDGPAEKFRAASEATRQNAEAVASFQEEAGTRINPERVIDADVRAEGGGAPEVAKEIQKAGNPSYRHDAADLKDASEKARKAEAEPVRDDYDAMADEQEEVLRKLLEESGVEAKFAEGKELPESIDIDGVQRSTKDSTGRRLGRTEEEVRNFWAWFGDSKVVDADGKPLVVYHGTAGDFNEFSFDELGKTTGAISAKKGFFFSENPYDAASYILPAMVQEKGHIDIGAINPFIKSAEADEFISRYRAIDGIEKAASARALEALPKINRLSIQNADPVSFAQKIDDALPIKIGLRREPHEFGGENIFLGRIPVGRTSPRASGQGFVFDSFLDNYDKLRSGLSGFYIQEARPDLAKLMQVYLKAESPKILDSKIRKIRIGESATRRKGTDATNFLNVSDPIPSNHWIVYDPTQIKSATGNRGTFDPTNPDIRMAEGAAESDLRIQDAAAAIEERFGAGTIETARKAGFEIVAAKDLPEQAQRANVVGVTVGKKSYLAADRMNRQDAAAYFLHEYGVHVGMEGMLGAKGFADIQAKVGDLLSRDPDLQAVVASLVPATTKSAHIAEERLAYLVQHMEGVLSGRENWPKGAAWLRVADPETRRAIVELVREIVAKVKAYLYSEFPALRWMELSAEDIHAIAVRSLQHGAEMDRRARFAESGGTPELDEIKAAKDLSKRVRDVYRKAYDKVASVSDQMDREQLTAAAMSAGLDEAEARGLVDRFRNFQGDAKAAADAHESEAALNRYRATLNAVRLHEGMRIILGFKGREAEGALALDGGSEHNRFGARVSVDYWRRSWKDILQNGAAQELHKAGLWKLARRKEFARNIINALYDVQTNSTENLGRTYTKDHLAVAKVMEKYQRLGLMEMKRHGVDIGQLEGRMLHQDHDPWALRNFANNGRTGATRSAIRGLFPSKKRVKIGDPAHREAWIDFVLPLLEEKTYDGRVVDREYLAGAYNLLAGFKEPSQDADLLGGRYGPGGVKGEAERRSGMARNMKFKGPDEWAAYQQRCGNPDFMSNFMGELDGMARSIGIMRVYGPGGEFTRQMMHQAVGHQLSDASALKWQSSRKDRETSLAVLNGSVNIPASEVIANVATNTRNIFKASILGGSILSQTGDFVNVGKARALRFNRGIGGVYGETLSHVRDFIRTIKPGAAQKAVIEAFGADIDATIGGLLREVENGDSRGFTSRLVEKVYQYQGATWLNRHNRQAAALGMSNWLGSESRRGWNEIEPTTREFLQEHRFTEADWELIRRGEMIADDGRSYLTPESVAALSDEAIADHLRATGSQATERHVAAWRVDTANRISAMMTDYVSQALTEPSIRSRMVTTGGTQAGTWSGELVRSMWDVKSFMVSQVQRGIQTERFGRSSDPRARVKAGSASQYLAIANYMAAMTMAGYVSYVLKGWASGVSRRGLLDQNNEDDRILRFDLPIFDDRVLFASMAQGGALGIYGDFLFSDNDRFGGGFLQTLSGPSIGKLEDIYKIWRAWKTAGDDTDPEKAERERGALANQMVRMLKGSIPGSNLWYSRQILDRYIWWNVQEAINPAALDRLEKSAAKRGDDYVFTRPTDARN